MLLGSLRVQAAVAVAIRRSMRPQAICPQSRSGNDRVIVELVKFHTMREPDVNYVTDADCLPRIGHFLRSTRLYEVPTLWNEVKGALGLLGPPLLVECLPFCMAEEHSRQEVRPGITGPTQVSGRNVPRGDESFAFDVAYAQACSLRLDLHILARTATAVVPRTGITREFEVKVQPFVGSAPAVAVRQKGNDAGRQEWRT